jgi:hypothetical protein
MGKVNQYFAEFVNPRICNGMGDLFEFGLLPRLKGLYRKDYSNICPRFREEIIHCFMQGKK